ncbi:MAG: universal stress protein [Bacteroidota bacterium]|nr:universal stress protein [Bacteroidota bacterium]MEC7083664.1 universal stress protein [Bacteroidota bacterium]MEC7127436.1 universal stress protein [Bacteroidota bacterium]MEC7526826.1 universal stress protein [Bacteroidota bacterium]MEC7618587.1 universal stress protein [Bacteroidota bacterium]|tara:strand:- start:1009 stop:1839 length:831 start_codon:yes stop_codon:yes gene_type:complete
MKTKLLVPTDFTNEAHSAIQHAVKLGVIVQAEVILLNVVKDKSDIPAATTKLKEEEKWAKTVNDQIDVRSIVRVGNIFDDIGDAASELGVSLIIMGTHGASGWQKITGSYALKVITNSSVPFIVVQDQLMNDTGYDSIVVPLDLNNETKQKLEMVASIAHYFDSEVHLITPNESDEFLSNKLKANRIWAAKYLKGKNVKFTTQIVDDGDNLLEGVFKLSKKVEADLIAIMNLQKNSLMGVLGSSYQQEIIANKAKVPVLCLNPLKSTIASGSILVR